MDFDIFETKLTIWFGDIPLDKDFTLTLTNWYEVLQDQYGKTNQYVSLPFYCEEDVWYGDSKKPSQIAFKGASGTIQLPLKTFYEKWRSAKKQISNTTAPVKMTIMKHSFKKWHIVSVVQEDIC